MEREADLADLPLFSASEEWRPVLGYEGYYEVSNLGRVRSLKRKIAHARNGAVVFSARVLSIYLDSYGYPVVGLCKGGNPLKCKVHRLVAVAFLGSPPPDRPQINHIDGNKQNSDPRNLEWCNTQENTAHAIANGLRNGNRGERHHNAKLKPADVLEVRRLFDAKVRRSVIAAKFGIVEKYVREVGARKSWAHL